MATLLPEGEGLKQAITWVSAALQDDPDQLLANLVEKAVFKFDLSPVDAEFLAGLFSRRQTRS